MMQQRKNRPYRRTFRRRFHLLLLSAVSVVLLPAVAVLLIRTPAADPPAFAQTPSAAAEGADAQGGASAPALPKNSGTGTILSVPYLDQSARYPTGCEIVSAAMLLRFYGYSISTDTLIDRYLDRKDLTVSGGQRYGPSPDRYFIGSPYSLSSYGCFAPVIVNTLNRVLKSGASAADLTGTAFDQLISDYIDRGTPVLVWASINMKEIAYTSSWILEETGEIFRWPGGEHCLVLVGYDEASYFFNDPYENSGVKGYAKAVVEQRYRSLGRQAVAVG